MCIEWCEVELNRLSSSPAQGSRWRRDAKNHPEIKSICESNLQIRSAAFLEKLIPQAEGGCHTATLTDTAEIRASPSNTRIKNIHGNLSGFTCFKLENPDSENFVPPQFSPQGFVLSAAPRAESTLFFSFQGHQSTDTDCQERIQTQFSLRDLLTRKARRINE